VIAPEIAQEVVMSRQSRRGVLRAGVFGVACACLAPRFAYAESPSGKYACPPCGCSADGKTFDAPGDCPACGMPLAPKPADPPKGAGAPPPKARDDAAPGAIASNRPSSRRARSALA
jgi:hypothetical protein